MEEERKSSKNNWKKVYMDCFFKIYRNKKQKERLRASGSVCAVDFIRKKRLGSLK